MLVSLAVLPGCRNVQKKVDAAVWLISNERQEIYRDAGTDIEFVPLSDPLIEQFSCFHSRDIEKAIEYFNRKCD